MKVDAGRAFPFASVADPKGAPANSTWRCGSAAGRRWRFVADDMGGRTASATLLCSPRPAHQSRSLQVSPGTTRGAGSSHWPGAQILHGPNVTDVSISGPDNAALNGNPQDW